VDRKTYIRSSLVRVTLVSMAGSAMITLLVESLTPHPNYLQALFVAVLVPSVVAPPLIYWHGAAIFDLEASRRRIEELSRTDELTGLWNRRFFWELAEDALRLAARHHYPVSVLMMDLDRFKTINDRHGHQTGDAVLEAAARVLHAAIRKTDVLARYGGEEFVLLMPHTGGGEALWQCERLRRELAARGGEGLPRVTISIGVAASDRHGHDLDRLLVAADRALYQAKDQGRDCCVLSA